MYKKYLALNNLQWLICHKTKPFTFFLKFYSQIVFSLLQNTLNSEAVIKK